MGANDLFERREGAEEMVARTDTVWSAVAQVDGRRVNVPFSLPSDTIPFVPICFPVP